MRSKIFTMLVLAISVMGCAAPQQKPAAKLPPKEPHVFKPIDFKYDPATPAALSFSRQLDIPAWQCDMEATTGNVAVRYGDRQAIAVYSDSLMECFKHSRAQGDEAVARLKAAKVSPKQAELSKDLYAKWSTYLSGMSPYQKTDLRAKAAYEAAKQALITEVKFSN
ncbi:hypothetical protein YA0697_14315 [Pseudomonas viridiflava]|uniref:hypothetical protein n=1 Tax=Pseudomonas viridiflava TaxID=33069 RepID=UPI000F0511A8|nr:hypothetical protein [Pseudomonas viridiflava]MBI6682888.1 hypothetical protein [Pseudomonas viridiflava]